MSNAIFYSEFFPWMSVTRKVWMRVLSSRFVCCKFIHIANYLNIIIFLFIHYNQMQTMYGKSEIILKRKKNPRISTLLRRWNSVNKSHCIWWNELLITKSLLNWNDTKCWYQFKKWSCHALWNACTTYMYSVVYMNVVMLVNSNKVFFARRSVVMSFFLPAIFS